ncbi:hypothetical protein [Microcoleus sp.]|uniref:hypothetical protein n=1 Tax=Microcoleus sp. TaxID=44472 RepID=UPI00403E6838
MPVDKRMIDQAATSVVEQASCLFESTVNTQPFSFSTPPSTVNSQQPTIIPVQPELI